MTSNWTKPLLLGTASLFLALSAATLAAAENQRNIASKWNSVLLNEIILNRSAPFENTRQIAILNLSLYDAIEAVEQKYELFDVKVAPVPDASWQLLRGARTLLRTAGATECQITAK